jgi:Domain of Unknown Function (DUF908)
VESALKCSLQVSAIDLLADSFELSSEQRGVYYDSRSVSFTVTIPPATPTTERLVADYESAGFSLEERSALVCVVSDIRDVTGDAPCRELFAAFNASTTAATRSFPAQAQFGLLWQIRLLRLLLTSDGRRLFLECLYHAVHTLLCCHPDGTLLSQFFQDKPDFVKDFLALLRTGPGSVGYVKGLVPIYIRQLACLCLGAIIGSKDTTNVSVLGGRFSWLQHDLGVNRYTTCLSHIASAFIMRSYCFQKYSWLLLLLDAFCYVALCRSSY